MYLNRLIREDRDRQIEMVSKGKDYSSVENEISDIEVVAVSLRKILQKHIQLISFKLGSLYG